jgi:hypothetical protein
MKQRIEKRTDIADFGEEFVVVVLTDHQAVLRLAQLTSNLQISFTTDATDRKRNTIASGCGESDLQRSRHSLCTSFTLP